MKRISKANTNLILILSIVIVMIIFSFLNYAKFYKAEKIISALDEKVADTEQEEIQNESMVEYLEDLSRFGLDAGNVGLDVLRVLFVWIPLIHASFLLLFAIISKALYKPSFHNIIAYRVLMTFAYLNIVVTIVVLIVGIIIHYSILKKIKMIIFGLQCLAILILNCRITYSGAIYDIETNNVNN